LGRESYRDLLDVGPEEFHERLLAGPPFPTISSPTPKGLAEAFGEAAKDRRGIVHLHVLGRLWSMGRASGAR
jgi:fatty acid-binding protein DegV